MPGISLTSIEAGWLQKALATRLASLDLALLDCRNADTRCKCENERQALRALRGKLNRAERKAATRKSTVTG